MVNTCLISRIRVSLIHYLHCCERQARRLLTSQKEEAKTRLFLPVLLSYGGHTASMGAAVDTDEWKKISQMQFNTQQPPNLPLALFNPDKKSLCRVPLCAPI